MLTMPERLLLISIDDRGRPRDPRSTLGHALAGAVLTELLLAGRLRHHDGRVAAATAGPTGEALLDEVVAEIRGEQRPRTLKWWVQRLASRHRGRKPVRDRVIDQLTERGVLATGERRLLGLVPVATHQVADPAIAERARAAVGEVLLGRQEPDEGAAGLVALVQVSGLVDVCVPHAERRQARRRAKQVAAGDQVGAAVKRVQEEVTAAVTAAVVASAAAASSSGNASS
jgi:Golgi phosphoprotein 3 (GPP34)